jgi:hypothetical protein
MKGLLKQVEPKKEKFIMKNRIFLIGLLLLIPALWFAEDATPPAEAPAAARDPFLFTWGVRILGADVGIGWRGLTQVPNPDTIIWLIVGGGYEWLNYFRTSSNQLYTGTDTIVPGYSRIGGRLDLGLAQGFVWNEKLKFNLFEAFLFYRTRLDHVIDNPDVAELMIASGRPDALDLFQTSLFGGVSYNDLDTTDPHRNFRGLYAEASAEWGPEWLLNDLVGRADFIRLNLTAKYFLPVFDISPQTEMNQLSGFMGAFFGFDWCDGASIPANIQQTFGGRNPRYAMGYAVRGYEDTLFDGRLKAVLNVDFRVNLPQFKIIDVITPGLVAFFDSGYFNFLYYDEQGFLFSAGLGVFVNVWKLTSFTLYTIFDFTRPRADGAYWNYLNFQFDAHF